ncbi:IPT/TIG domain-containing protein [Aquimarina pacifica]|uniref:IPT/TIG domain-containing protein n=1 Tax=Aquimarina pacifica TaxID=1296415 RepID=UPI00046F2271|nr:IPT/TIG domain-containing protein [Aquimarina pacifica]
MRTIRTARFIRGNQNTQSGLFLSPYITEVIRGRLPKNTTQTVTIKGHHFDPGSTVKIVEQSIEIAEVNFINPTQIDIVITSCDVEGLFTVVVCNNDLDSGDSGKDLVEVKDGVWIDLRTIDLGDSELLDKTLGVFVLQDVNRGLFAGGEGSFWNRGVKFKKYTWKRSDALEFNFVFTGLGSGFSMFGIGGSHIDVSALENQSDFKGEIQLFYDNGGAAQLYGGGQDVDWIQNIGIDLTFEDEKFYKLKFHRSGIEGSLIGIYEVAPDDFDVDIQLLYEWVSSCPSDDPILMPYWSAVNNSNLFLTAFKIG